MSDYWINYWKKVNISDSQTTIGRTKFGKPVSLASFEKEVKYIISKLNLTKNDFVLDICAGNGLVSQYLAPLVKKVIAVDISQKLLDNFIPPDENIEKICQNLTFFDFTKPSYNKVVWYFSIQYFSLSEAVRIIKDCLNSLDLGGKFYISDIPDIDQKWNFYSKAEYKSFYFEKLYNKEDHVGTWYKKEFFIYLLKHLGYKNNFQIIEKLLIEK